MHLLPMIWLLVLALPISAHAQTSGTGATTESGTVMETTTSEILLDILNIAPTRVAKTAKQLVVPEKQQAAWEKESASIRQRMTDQRIECRDVIRRANRDQRMGKILQCQRAMLLLDANLLRNQSAYIGIIPFIDTKLKATATGAIANLESAEMAIVDGIDTGLFEQEEQLIAARNNLRVTYREPVWLGLLRVRIDRELTNLLYIAKLLKERTDVDTSAPVREVALCLEGAAEGLQTAKSTPERQTAGQKLLAAREQDASCRGLLRALGKTDRQQEKNEADAAASGKEDSDI